MIPKGFKHSPETIEKMRAAALKRRPRTEAENRRHGLKIRKWLKDPSNHPMFGKKHTPEALEKMRRAQVGKYRRENSPHWTGGIWKDIRGYVVISAPDHPHGGRRHRVLAHRLIVESHLKRYLKVSEPVHHINKQKGDNQPENLMAFKTKAAHEKFECGKEVPADQILFDGRLLKH